MAKGPRPRPGSKGGALKGNTNGVKHGASYYHRSGRLPTGCSYIKRNEDEYRKDLEEAVRDKYGEVSLYHASLIQEACGSNTEAELLRRYKRTGKDLGEPDQARLDKQRRDALTHRTACLEKLGLDAGAAFANGSNGKAPASIPAEMFE